MPKNTTPARAPRASFYHLRNDASSRRATLDIRGTIGVSQEWRDWGADAAGNMREIEDELKALGQVDEIQLNIYSLGGSVWDALALHSVLSRHPARIIAHIDGIAASAATIIMLAADEIEVPENAYVMIHNPIYWGDGDYRDFKAIVAKLEKWTADCVDLYVAHITSRYPDRDAAALRSEIAAKMDAETWLTGAEAVELGLADRTSDAVALAASADPNAAEMLTRYRKAPDSVRALIDTPAALSETTSPPTMSKPTDPVTPAALAAPAAPVAEVTPPVAAPATPAAPVAEVTPPAAPVAEVTPPAAPVATPAAPVATLDPAIAAAIGAAVAGAVQPLATQVAALQNNANLAASGANPNAWGAQPPVSAPVESGGSPKAFAEMSAKEKFEAGCKQMHPRVFGQ